MNKEDIFVWVYLLGIPILIALAFIIFYVKNFIKRRKETEEEREIREQKWKEKKRKRMERVEMLNWLFVPTVGILLFLTGVSFFFYQCFFWLKNGVWMEIPLLRVIEYIDESIIDKLKTNWNGVQKIIVWFLKQSTALVSVVSGFIIAWIGYRMGD